MDSATRTTGQSKIRLAEPAGVVETEPSKKLFSANSLALAGLATGEGLDELVKGCY